MTTWGLFSLSMIFIIMLAMPAQAQSPNALFFPETGHWLMGEFLDYYLSGFNSSLLFGLPVTDAFFDARTNQLVQYFQKALFVLVQSENSEKVVIRDPLGEKLYKPGVALRRPGGFPPCRKFPNGLEVCYAFLDFYLSNGGEAQFGLPISNFELQQDLIVQSFQFARFEWHPENPPGLKVTLSNLGIEYFELVKEDENRLKSDVQNASPQVILELRVRAFVERIKIAQSGVQRVFVVIEDQNLRPVAGVNVNIQVSLPNEQKVSYLLSPTNEKGITGASFPCETTLPGLAIIEVTATYNRLVGNARTFYRHWW